MPIPARIRGNSIIAQVDKSKAAEDTEKADYQAEQVYKKLELDCLEALHNGGWSGTHDTHETHDTPATDIFRDPWIPCAIYLRPFHILSMNI